jgi:multiple sugar transport system permease protein
MFPVPLLSIPLAVSFLKIGLYDTILSVALLHTAMALPFACIIMIGVFAQISKELEEAAMVFGANRIKAFIKISLPLALPGIAAVSILTFITSWNEVFASAILTVESRPLSAHILSLLQASPLHFKFAGGFFMIIPSLFFIFFVRRYLFNMWGMQISEK